MRLVMMTDMEGSAGIIDSANWCLANGTYYQEGKKLVTEEVNAAARAFFDNGFTEILVLDAHGFGGVNLIDLDSRVHYQRGFVGPYPMGLTEKFDAIAWVGQHAKAGTPYAHLCHTSSMNVLDQRINGVSMGEFGMLVYMAATMDIRPIYGSGDKAFCEEATALCPQVVTTCVKEGLMPGSGEECLAEEYRLRNTVAVHIHPLEARKKIYEDAAAAARAFCADPERFRVEPLKGPFTVEMDYRTDHRKVADKRKYVHETDLIAALNMSWDDRPR